jgi:hypothetical protein
MAKKKIDTLKLLVAISGLTLEEQIALGYEIWDEAETEIFQIDSIVHLCLTGKPLSQVMEEELDTSWLDD